MRRLRDVGRLTQQDFAERSGLSIKGISTLERREGPNLHALQALASAGGLTKLCVIAGKPRVGKSALALQIPHRLKPPFTDGHLYAHLRRDDNEPASGSSLLNVFLLALGIGPETLPAVSADARLCTGPLADRRHLIALDNGNRPSDAGRVERLDSNHIGSRVLLGDPCASSQRLLEFQQPTDLKNCTHVAVSALVLE